MLIDLLLEVRNRQKLLIEEGVCLLREGGRQARSWDSPRPTQFIGRHAKGKVRRTV